ncbi:uncharacterized protein LAESUDRAFT_728162 [Laetiporus sulphureus 93-53]|uniref:Uncharacterized protein n=1 Tax=Laetiporus sulphureus 93-53 TaxID=1314785 RepID=A0A165D8M0_9APHY|nr:uncharacterized protein LAESUDRAFT_728162 [Laetiporus sulphureus 93-53]KZT04337.1 hypothetical protein LAESUDRAFT_728162 [Laetiporus sulphureus 93-53]
MATPSKDSGLDNTTAIERKEHLSHDKQPIAPPRLRFTTVYDYSNTGVVVKTFHDEAGPEVIDRPLQRRQSPELQVGLLDLLREREQHINAEFSKRLLKDMKDLPSKHGIENATSSGQETKLFASSKPQTMAHVHVDGQSLGEATELESRSQETTSTAANCKDIAVVGVRADVPGVPRAGAIAKPFS